MRTPLIVGNWKMFKTVHETVAFVKELRSLVKDLTGIELAVVPPFTAVHAAAEAARASAVSVGAQDLHWEREGAFTGEVSAGMIREAGAEYVLIGHSERRTLFGETDETVHRKLLAALGAGLTPVVCVGETLEQRDAGTTMSVIDAQLQRGLDRITPDQMAGLVLAYEPVWAIGTGRTASPAQAQDVHAHIRHRLRAWFGAEAASQCRLLYGGSVKPDNIEALMAEPDVDGALVGGASLDVASFADMLSRARRAPGAGA
jgi:triosephosphate isomerase